MSSRTAVSFTTAIRLQFGCCDTVQYRNAREESWEPEHDRHNQQHPAAHPDQVRSTERDSDRTQTKPIEPRPCYLKLMTTPWTNPRVSRVEALPRHRRTTSRTFDDWPPHYYGPQNSDTTNPIFPPTVLGTENTGSQLSRNSPAFSMNSGL